MLLCIIKAQHNDKRNDALLKYSDGVKLKHTNEFQLLVETRLLKGTSRGDVGLTTNPSPGNGHGGLLCLKSQDSYINWNR